MLDSGHSMKIVGYMDEVVGEGEKTYYLYMKNPIRARNKYFSGR